MKDSSVSRVVAAAAGIGLALACASVAGATEIRVGPDVMVSAAHANWLHVEMLAAADPLDSQTLIACSIAYANQTNYSANILYQSRNAISGARRSGARKRQAYVHLAYSVLTFDSRVYSR